MVTPQEIRTVTFEKNMRGYRCEDVDEFLQAAADSMDALQAQIDQLNAQKEELIAQKGESDHKLYILAEKIEDYRKDEDTLKTALLNAQRMGENIIREAKQKAESILREANIKSEDLTRSSKEQVREQKLELERLQYEVSHFKTSVLALYKQHIESLSTLPDEEEKQPAEPEDLGELPTKGAEPAALPQPAPVPQKGQDEPAATPVTPALQPAEASEGPAAGGDLWGPREPLPQPAAPEQPAEPEAQAPQADEPEEAGPIDIWQVDFQPSLPQEDSGAPASAETMLNFPQQYAAPAAPAAEAETPLPSIFEGFQGIRFSD